MEDYLHLYSPEGILQIIQIKLYYYGHMLCS